jgi:thiol-disulfide isomerase/thioredoxin
MIDFGDVWHFEAFMDRRDFLHCTLAAAMGMGALSAPPALAADSLFDLTLPDAHGVDHALADYLGRPLVVNFWATWCPPCLREMPELDALQKKYPSVRFVGLAIDTADNVRKFVEKMRVSYPLLVVGHGGIQLMRSLGNKKAGVPFTVVYDKNGIAGHHVVGEIDPKNFEQLVQDVSR